MRKIAVIFCTLFLTLKSYSAGDSSGFGLSAGFGVPYITQFGINYKMSNLFGIYANYNNLDLSVGEAKLALTMPELMLNYHPFAGSFFIGLGVGQESLLAKSTETLTGTEVKIEVKATTTIVKSGWMWGISNNGFWFGMDAAYIMPSGAKTTITAPGVATTDQSYLDAIDAADKFGKSSYLNITFARLGWIF